jgi:hypothetical protein
VLLGNVFGTGFGNGSGPEYNISPETVPGKQILLMSSQNQHFVKKQRPVFVLFRQPSLVIFRAKRM